MTLAPAQPALVYSPHPLLAAAGRRLVAEPFLPGESIAAYIERVGIRLGSQPMVLHLNDSFIPRSEWPLAIPRHGDLITLRAIVRDGGGGGGGGSDPVRTVAMIAVMVYAPYLAGPAGLGFQAGTLAYSAANIAISVGGMMLVNSLLPPPAPNLSQATRRLDSPSPTYSLSGGSNRMRPFEPLPLVLGRHRMFPDADSKYYTEFEGDDQYLYQTFCFGLSEVALSDFRIGTTPLSSFAGVEIQESGADGKLTLFPANVDTAAGAALTYAAGWIQRTSSINATALAVDIAGSLYRSTQNGIESHSATVEIEYRAVGAGTWLPFVGAASAVTLTSDTRKPLRRTWRLTVAKGQYEVRLRRTTADDTDAQSVSDLSWSQLRTYQPDEADYTGRKRVALRIKASGQLQGQVEQFNAIASALVPVWNGTSWVAQATSNPAWLFLYFARGKKIGNERAFGALLADARIDIEALKEWGAWCDTKSLTFDAVFDQPMNCNDMLHAIARCGRAFPTWATGKLGVAWEASGKPHVAVFGMSNIKRNSFQVEYLTEKLADEIVLKFVNPDLDWQQDSVRAKVPGVTTPERTVTMELFGCTVKGMAGREANLLAAKQKYHRRKVTWETDLEGSPAQKGDVAILSHDLTQWGYSGRILAGNGTSLTLERKVPFTPAQSHYVGVVFPHGYLHIFDVTYQAGESDTIALAEAWPSVDDIGNTLYTPDTDPNFEPFDYKFVFEPKATPGKKVLITHVIPLDERNIRLVATDEEADYYLQENNPYTYVTPDRSNWSAPPTLSNLQISETLVRVGTGYAVRLTLTWDISGTYTGATVRAVVNGVTTLDLGQTTERRIDFDVTDGATLAIDVYGYGALGELGRYSRLSQTYTVIGAAAEPPPDVPWFLVDGNRLTWGEADTPDLAGYEIRFHYGINRDFGTAAPLHRGLLTTSPLDMPVRPDGQVTLLIKAVDTAPLQSNNAAIIITDFGDAPVANVVETFDLKVLGWPGTVTGGSVDGLGELAATEISEFYRANEAQFYGYDSVEFYPAAAYSAMTYESGWVIPSKAARGSAMTLPRALEGDAIQISYRPVGPNAFYADLDSEVFYSAAGDAFYDPPPDYSAWPGSVIARDEPYEFRVSTASGATRGRLGALIPTVDVPDIAERLNDIVLASGGTRLPIAKTYSVIKTVNLTLQDDGGTATRVRVLDKNPTLGPLVQADASGTPTTANIDALIQGY